MGLIQTRRYAWWGRAGAECDCAVADVRDVDCAGGRVYCWAAGYVQDAVAAGSRAFVVGRVVAWPAVVVDPKCDV
jgi:hypothetical protein